MVLSPVSLWFMGLFFLLEGDVLLGTLSPLLGRGFYQNVEHVRKGIEVNYKLEHACIRVMDLQKSIEFYQKALGLREVRRKDFPEWEFTLVYLSDEGGNFEIELTYNYSVSEPYELGNGFSHFALIVDDLEASHQHHQGMGYELGELKGLPGAPPMFYFITDPDGYKVEIIRAKTL